VTFLRSLLFNLFYYVSTLLLALGGLFIRWFAPHRAYALAVFWARLQLAAARLICGIRLEVSGQEYLPRAGAALLACRHESAFDTMVWLTLVPRACYVLKIELARIPLFGAIARLSGMIPVDRGAGAAAMRQLMREGRRAAREDRQIVIFPEGTRAKPGTLLPLQPGIAALAAATRLPVIPVVTDSGHRWGRRAFHKYPGLIHIRLLPPLSANLQREALMAGLEHALRDGMAALAAEHPV
jgi:1-acyl-sn-glycerol-3-phosphate acyltransferase